MASERDGERGGGVFLIAAVAIGLAATAMCWLYLRQQSKAAEKAPETAILVAKTDLPPGTALTAEQVDTASVPADMVGVTGAALRPDFLSAVIGQKVNRFLAAGAPLNYGDLIPFRQLKLKADERAVSVRLDPNSTAASFLQPGDRVELYVTKPIARPAPAAPPAGPDATAAVMAALAAAARPDPAAEYKSAKVADEAFAVLAVGARAERELVLPSGDANAAGDAQTITIAVRAEQVAGILQATGAGQLSVSVVLCPAAGNKP